MTTRRTIPGPRRPEPRRAFAAVIVWLAVLAAPAGSVSAAPADLPLRLEAGRVVAFGDVHGAYEPLLRLLQQAGIVDADLHWSGGATHLVSLGDILDRGPDARAVIDLLMRLQDEAASAGGRVHVLLGNHELMNLIGDLRYVPEAEFASFADPASTAAEPVPRTAPGTGEHPGRSERYEAFSPAGVYGRWLLAQPAALVINGTAFVHGGLPPVAATMGPEELDRAVKTRLRELLDLRGSLEDAGVIPRHGDVQALARELDEVRKAAGDPSVARADSAELDAKVERFIELAGDDLLADGGVMWYRGTALCHDLLERPVLSAALRRWQADRVVVGHSPTWDHRVRARFGGLAILADTGMLREYYAGQPAALVIEGGLTRVLYPDGSGAAAAPDPRSGLEFDGLAAGTVEQILARGAIRALPADGSPVGDGAATPAASPPRATLPPGTTLVEVADGDTRMAALFEPGSRAEVQRELAAYRLDGLLGLGLVAPVAAREFDGRKGVVSARWTNTLDEQARSTAGLVRENWCATGSVFQLLYVFDALVRNAGRTANTMLYDRRTWQFASAGHADTFGKGRDLPPYLANAPRVIPPALAEALRGLSEATLVETLGDALSKAQILALLDRRDDILSTWTIAQGQP